MNVQEAVAALGLQVIVPGDMTRDLTGGYASDLLSCVMARAQAGNVWVTLQAHANVVAVACLLDLAAVLLTEGVVADDEMLARARENEVTLLGSPQPTFTVVGRLASLGVAGEA
jgi:hypothetical protein